MEIKAFFEHEIFSADNYKVLACSTDDVSAAGKESKYKAKKAKYSFIAILNNVITIKEFEKRKKYLFAGVWETSKKYGKQFKVESVEEIIGESKEEIIDYLQSFEGIGNKTAVLIYDKFGSNSINVIKNRPDDLCSVKGISQKKVEVLISEINKKEQFKNVINFFSDFSIPTRKVKKIYEQFELNSIEIVKENPFVLSLNNVLTFVEANSIAIDLNVALHSSERISQCCLHCIQKFFRANGHIFCLKDALIKKTSDIINKDVKNNAEISVNEISKSVEKLIVDGILIEVHSKSNAYVYFFKDYAAEKLSAQRLIDFMHFPKSNFNLDFKKINDEILTAENKFSITLNSKQKNAVAAAMSSNISIITGGPGTGKTTILKVILEIFKNNYGNKIGLCAPTGKAARRMAESTGIFEASTIHSLLKIEEDHEWSPENTNTSVVDYDLLVVDEISMLDMSLMFLLISSIPYTCKVVFLGDANQIPSVGPGAVLKEMISSQTLPVTILDKIYRQAEQSNIVLNAYKMQFDKDDFVFADDFQLVDNLPGSGINQQIANIFMSEIKKGKSIDDVQILTPYRTEAANASVQILNPIVQSLINPPSMKKKDIKIMKTVFRVGDKIIQQKNNEFAKNGDIGKILDISYSGENSVKIHIDFGDDRIVDYTPDEMQEYKIELGYVLTIHKSQGSEYDTVIMPIIEEHKFMLKRNIVYTAWTRAKNKVLIVGNRNTIIVSAHSVDNTIRNTLLAKRMVARESRYRKRVS